VSPELLEFSEERIRQDRERGGARLGGGTPLRRR